MSSVKQLQFIQGNMSKDTAGRYIWVRDKVETWCMLWNQNQILNGQVFCCIYFLLIMYGNRVEAHSHNAVLYFISHCVGNIWYVDYVSIELLYNQESVSIYFTDKCPHNSHAKQLMNICKACGLLVVNGALGNDERVWEFTVMKC